MAAIIEGPAPSEPEQRQPKESEMRSSVLAALLAATGPAIGVAADPPPPWSGEASAGVVVTSGNSESSTANAKGEVVFNSERWRNTFNGSALNTEATDPATGIQQRTAERYLAGNKTDFNFTEHNYAFLALEFEEDLFGPVRERTSETAGYGRKILTGPAHTLEAELGAGARQTEAQVTEEKNNDAIGRGRVAYKWNFSETSNFAQTVKVESGDSNTFTESVTELRVSLVGKLFALGSYTLRNNSDVPAGAKKTDTVTTVSLGWSFGK
jgi:putative salt-induced outer membrane protein